MTIQQQHFFSLDELTTFIHSRGVCLLGNTHILTYFEAKIGEMMGEERLYDLVVLGATGYTGQYVAEEVARIADTKRPDLKFALAGRNRDKLTKTLDTARENTGLKMADVPLVVADVNDEESLLAMAKQARVVINCVGPYRFYGDRVVSACIRGGASHVDISGEPQYLERVQLEHSKAAEERGVYVVGACGFDSIPADLGTTFLQEIFPGDLNSVEAVVGMDDTSQGSAPINLTTLECAVLGLTHAGELKSVRSQLFTTPLPKPTYKATPRGKLFYCDEAKRWCVPNMASDRSVVSRSQRLNYELWGARPTQFNIYFGMQSLTSALAAIFLGLVLYFMTRFVFTRRLLLKYPEVFTFGAFARGGPKRSSLTKLRFVVTLTGKGWSKKQPDPSFQHPNPPDTTRTIKVCGPDPGYFATATIITQAALTILDEADRMPGRGGVLPPAAAFLETSLRSRLIDNGITFTVVEE
ncbi:hypothetical protein Pmani_002513 [Petrolisthes manimaculis]|uniref:Saccharopine dehydrogenase NADP binding domain-containing protein n=1 Tax=Petrolisthes manimaculis TaxID=1843537 RepID=A0AAE1QIJ7_9EUCA|nr:hypothetical protein Pmani_002513 [Petrolisthes manimaculis]